MSGRVAQVRTNREEPNSAPPVRPKLSTRGHLILETFGFSAKTNHIFLPKTFCHIRPRKRKSIIPSRQLFHKQKKSEEATSKYTATQNPQFQFNLTYKIKENINQWRIVFWDSKRQEFTLENPSLNYQRLSVPLRSISAFC